MGNTYCDIQDVYEFKTEEKPIKIKVTTGNAQISSYSIFQGTRLEGVNSDVELSRSDDLGDKIFISAVVRDIRPETNWVNIIVTIAEGNKRKKFGPYSREVEKDNDTVTFSITISLQ